jgi:hypothetical protein
LNRILIAENGSNIAVHAPQLSIDSLFPRTAMIIQFDRQPLCTDKDFPSQQLITSQKFHEFSNFREMAVSHEST